MKIEGYNVVLASNSPRRKELLQGLGLSYEVRVISDIDESYPNNLEGEDIPKYISGKKADAYLDSMKDDDLVITADTIVYSENRVLGKPNGPEDASSMLEALAGKEHDVITGVTLLTKQWKKQFAVTSKVRFASLSKDETNYYVENFRPFDKAGAYGIQEWIGYIGVEKIEGSFYNVMGLPVQRLYAELKKNFRIEL